VKDITDAEFSKIRDYIRSNLGISLSDEKKTLVFSRLRTTIAELGMESFSDYFNFLVNDKTGEAMVIFENKITTNHTFFMREAEHFEYLKKHVLPYIEESYKNEKDLRLWCTAASSGEEAVILQIVAHEYFKQKGDWNTEILATDISSNALAKAVAARYPTESLVNIPKQWQQDYFTKIDANTSQVSDEIRKKIIYRKSNLMDNYNFRNKFHIIFCRNVMIYFDNASRKNVTKKFYDVLEPGGYLFIGHSESISNAASGFEYVMPAIYRKPL